MATNGGSSSKTTAPPPPPSNDVVGPTNVQHRTRVIIALDLDAFYVAACRKRDPSLNNLPVAIKQKHIVATCSYEARALGVRKLSLIKDAVRQCPNLILVNGEDLSYFRKVSNEIFHLVISMVKGGVVEKLGMDELFCDVTSMVDDMLLEQERGVQDWFTKKPYGVIEPRETAELLDDSTTTFDSLEPMTQRLLLGTHIARSIRERVSEEVGLTSSAGISTSKYLAKLVGNTHKPNKQTVFAPLHVRTAQHQVQQFLNPFSVRSLNGFGSAVTAKMCDTAIRALGIPEKTASAERMTVLVAREIFDRLALENMFGARLADRLYGLLHGIDDEPVIKAPEFPAQISIEDTYQGLAFVEAPRQFHILATSLLRRLEIELTVGAPVTPYRHQMVERPYDEYGDPLEDSSSKASMTVRDYDQIDMSKPTPTTASWKRYPLTMRLSVRQGYTNRVSRQTRMPVEVFDLRTDRTTRAAVLAQSCEKIFRTIVAQEGDRGEGLNLINIAALDLSLNRPAQSIDAFLRSAVKDIAINTPAPPPPAEIDMNFLLELPRELRAEVAEEYGIVLEKQDDDGDDDEVHSIISSQALLNLSQSNTVPLCRQCGLSMLAWMQHDHERWPETGLPRQDDDYDDQQDSWEYDFE